MALLCVGGTASTKKRFIAASSGAKVSVAEETDRCTQSIALRTLTVATASGETVVAMTVDCQGQLLAVCTSEKRLVVWECEGWTVRGERTVPKRVTSLQISEEAEYILTADKTGEVTRYRLSELGGGGEGEPVLGHLSMILDMVMARHDSHVITCDRDEKIRVSKYPNGYNIKTYCLGHTEFVSCVSLCKEWPHILLSSSGDGTLKSWAWRSGRLLDTHRCSLGGTGSATITQVACTGSRVPPLIVASLEGVGELVVLELSADGTFSRVPGRLSLHASPWSCAFDWSDRLWVCLADEQDPVQCWEHTTCTAGEFQRCSSPFHESLSHWDIFKDCRETRDWSELRKQAFDNVTDYLTRKEERIRQKAKQLPATEAGEKPPRTPPEKKAKLETVLS